MGIPIPANAISADLGIFLFSDSDMTFGEFRSGSLVNFNFELMSLDRKADKGLLIHLIKYISDNDMVGEAYEALEIGNPTLKKSVSFDLHDDPDLEFHVINSELRGQTHYGLLGSIRTPYWDGKSHEYLEMSNISLKPQ